MLLQTKISSLSKTILKVIKLNQTINQPINNFYLNPFNKKTLINSQKLYFSTYNKSTAPPQNSNKTDPQLNEIKDKIESMYMKLNQHQELSQLEKIIYPEALLHGQQDISKLSKLYDLLIERFQRQNYGQQGVQQLIKAGDFYRLMTVRRLKALKPYEKAKQLMQQKNFHKTESGAKVYKELCQKLSTLVEQDINKGQCRTVQQYFKKGLQEQKSGNQLQSLYYFHKGLCISQHQKIPDKLLHFTLIAHYLFLSQLMRPKCHELGESEQFSDSLNKYEDVEKIAEKWWKEEFSELKDIDKKNAFEQTMIWTHANKGDIYYRAHKYSQAAKCYQKVIQHYKKSKKPVQRLKIINIIQNLQKSYEHLGQTTKAVSFLEWAHDFVKELTLESAILKSRYLKPIDEMLIEVYQKCREWGNNERYKKRQDVIQKELREIVS